MYPRAPCLPCCRPPAELRLDEKLNFVSVKQTIAIFVDFIEILEVHAVLLIGDCVRTGLALIFLFCVKLPVANVPRFIL